MAAQLYGSFSGSARIQIESDSARRRPVLPDFPDCYPCNKFLANALCFNVDCYGKLTECEDGVYYEDSLAKQYCSVACMPAETANLHLYQNRKVLPPEPGADITPEPELHLPGASSPDPGDANAPDDDHDQIDLELDEGVIDSNLSALLESIIE